MDHLFPKPERAELFDSFVQSSQIGLIKPAREVYEYAAQQLDVEPSECVMIDDLLTNVDGAERAGMKSVLFTSNHQLQIDLEALLEASNA
jgi:putative hydrolase of the HAD superfamily